MKILFRPTGWPDSGPQVELRKPAAASSPYVTAPGACPSCKHEPFNIGGFGMHPSEDDRAWESTAACIVCKAPVGLLRVETDTLFGVREDEAILNGRCRVY